MTTIASDGRTVAADGLRVVGQEPVERSCQKLKIIDGTIYGITGTYAYFEPFIAWHREGGDVEKAPKVRGDNPGSLLVFGADSITAYAFDAPYPETFPYPAAFGSGADFASAALALGHTPEEAVAVAIEKNIYTGGAISVITIPRRGLAAAAE